MRTQEPPSETQGYLYWKTTGGSILVSGWCSDIGARAWRQELLTLRGHSNYVWGVAFSANGKRLATASWDKTAKVYALGVRELLNLARGRVTRTFTSEECLRYFQSEACPPLH